MGERERFEALAEKHRNGTCGCDDDNGAWCAFVKLQRKSDEAAFRAMYDTLSPAIREELQAYALKLGLRLQTPPRAPRPDDAVREAREAYLRALTTALEAHVLCYPDAKALADVAEGREADWLTLRDAAVRARLTAEFTARVERMFKKLTLTEPTGFCCAAREEPCERCYSVGMLPDAPIDAFNSALRVYHHALLAADAPKEKEQYAGHSGDSKRRIARCGCVEEWTERLMYAIVLPCSTHAAALLATDAPTPGEEKR